MEKEFSTVVVLDENKENVLLILREDFHIWALPGGGLESGETPADAAIREAYEETGYEVKIDKYIGSYHRPQLYDVRYVYRGCIKVGQALGSGPETLAVNWYPVEKLPKWLVPSVREIINDAISNRDEAIEKIQTYSRCRVISFRAMVKLRNFRNQLIRRK
jgi:8-oxo-dGTP diphosphatase